MTSSTVEGMRIADETISRVLSRTLTVPLLYYEANWPNSRTNVDILAIDRAGSGDVHVVEVKKRFDLVTASAIRQLMTIPAHYRWIAAPTVRVNETLIEKLAKSLAEHAIGLIGISLMENGAATANVLLKPLRGEPFDRTKVGDFVKKTVPDVEYGEVPRSSSRTELELLPKEKIAKHLDEAAALLEHGHERAAYLLAWSAIEAAMKLTLDLSDQAIMHSPSTLVRTIRENKRLTVAEAELLNNALAIRNALAHGLEYPREVNGVLHHLIRLARKLLKHV